MDANWNNGECFETFLPKLRLEGRRVILFLHNAPCHPETLQNNLTNMKLIFLPECTTSRLQPLHASIIRVFKCKYRKLVMKNIVSWIDESKKASEIIQDGNIAKATHWLQLASEDVSTDKIVHCFRMCGFKNSEANITCKDSEMDEEFASLLNQLRDYNDIRFEEFTTFDDNERHPLAK